MSRERATDGIHRIRLSSVVRRSMSFRLFADLFQPLDCFAPLHTLVADIAFIPFACCAKPAARAVITISIQARGERRAPRFNY